MPPYCRGMRASRLSSSLARSSKKTPLALIWNSPANQFGGPDPTIDYLLTHLRIFGRLLVHQHFGLQLMARNGSFQTLWPKIRSQGWQRRHVGTKQLALGRLFGCLFVFVSLSTQRIVFYLPPHALSKDELWTVQSNLAGFRAFAIERSLPSWTGHVAALAPLLATVKGVLDRPLAALFTQYGERVLADPDPFAAAHLGLTLDQYTHSFLDAIDAFLF